MKSKNTVTPNPSNIVERDKTGQFYKLMTPELKQLYELKLLDAPAYILLIVKTRRAAGWKWTFKVKDFCQEWGLNERTFYRAVSKLKTLGLLHWETGETITVWHSTDVARGDNDTVDMSINTLTPVSVPVSSVSVTETPVSALVSLVSSKSAKTFDSTSLDDAPDINQINLDQTDNIAADEKSFENKEKEATRESLLTEVLDHPAPLVIPKAASSPTILVDERDAINQMRSLGIERSEYVLALLKKHKGNDVLAAIAYVQQRVKIEPIKNITGAFVIALREGKLPVDVTPSFGLHMEANPPTEQQLQALEDARINGAIKDIFFSGIDNTHKVILLDGITQVSWWSYLGVDVNIDS